MASPAEARQSLIDLNRLSEAELRRLWIRIQNTDAAAVRDALMALLPELAAKYGDAAGALAADWYDELRDSAEVRGYFRAEPTPSPAPARFEALARWGVDPLFSGAPDPDAALARIAGGMQRTIADAHRLTVVESSIRDPEAQGWRRIGQGDNCGFCNMLISRGAVYSEAGVTFKSHDLCNCIAGPAFDPGRTVPTVALGASKRRISDAAKQKSNQRVYEWIRAH